MECPIGLDSIYIYIVCSSIQSGQAAEITVDGLATLNERLEELGKAVMLSCAVPIRMAQRILGVGKL